MSRAMDDVIDYSSTGANYTWDFSYLVAEEQILRKYFDISDGSNLMQFMFGAFAPPVYQGTNFAETDAIPLDQLSGIFPVSLDEIHLISRNTADSITSVGYTMTVDGNEIPFRSDTIETRYKFPMLYGNVYSSRGHSELDLNPLFDAVWKQYRQRSSHVDGWGSITTPYGTFDALRIRHSITETDSIYFDFGTGGTWFELPIPLTTQYEWWATGELEPVMRITTSDFSGTEIVTGIEYRDSYLGLDASLEEQELSFLIAPNPTIDAIHLKVPGYGWTYTILAADGTRVGTGVLKISDSSIDVSKLNAGQYYLLLRNTKGKWGVERFVKN